VTPTIRPAAIQDLDAVLALAAARRSQYATYQPRFWRPAPDAAAQQAPYLTGLITDPSVITLVAVTGAVLVGYVVGQVGPAPPRGCRSARPRSVRQGRRLPTPPAELTDSRPSETGQRCSFSSSRARWPRSTTAGTRSWRPRRMGHSSCRRICVAASTAAPVQPTMARILVQSRLRTPSSGSCQRRLKIDPLLPREY
jgi:hypothetical protein